MITDRDPWIAPALVAGRYQATTFLAPGTCDSSIIWRGLDLDTGDAVALKQYTTRGGDVVERRLYENEVRVQAMLIDSPRLARMLAHDDERAIVVKEFVEGPTLKGQLATSRALMLAVTLQQVGIWLDCHAAGLRGEHPAEGENIVLGPRGPRSVEACNAPSGGWNGDPTQFLGTAINLLGGTVAARARAIQLAREGCALAMVVARRETLRELDPDLAAAIEGNAGDLARMLAAVERLM